MKTIKLPTQKEIYEASKKVEKILQDHRKEFDELRTEGIEVVVFVTCEPQIRRFFPLVESL